MSKIYSGCAPLKADPITAGFDLSRALLSRPVETNFAIDFADPANGCFFTLKDLGKLNRLAADLVTKETFNTTKIHRWRSYEDLQVQQDVGCNLATIASDSSNSVSRFAAIITSGRTEQLNLLPSDRQTRGSRL